MQVSQLFRCRETKYKAYFLNGQIAGQCLTGVKGQSPQVSMGSIINLKSILRLCVCDRCVMEKNGFKSKNVNKKVEGKVLE